MTELTFTQNVGGGYWEATATVNADFNLHLERVKPEAVVVEMSTVSSAKKTVVFSSSEGEVFDQDFDALVYPKYISVKSWSQPTKAYITEAE